MRYELGYRACNRPPDHTPEQTRQSICSKACFTRFKACALEDEKGKSGQRSLGSGSRQNHSGTPTLNRSKDQFVRDGVERGDGFATGTVEGTGVDNACLLAALVAWDMGVAVEDVVDRERCDRAIEAAFVAVENGKGLAVKR